MKKARHVLDGWFKSISLYRKLRLEEVQKLYIEMINSDGKRRELLREELITGTLYLIPKFINNSLLLYINSNSYDMDDILSACNESWINVIDSGRLLEVSNYAQIFNKVFYANVVNQLSYNYLFHDELGVSDDLFYDLLFWYINQSIDNKEVTYKEFLSYLEKILNNCSSEHIAISLYNSKMIIYDLMVSIYNYLDEKKLIKNGFSERQIIFLKNLILDNIINIASVNANNVECVDYNDLYLNKLLEEEILSVIFNNNLMNEKQKSMIRVRYGLDDGQFRTLEDTGKIFGITKAGMFSCEKNVLKKVRKKEILGLLEDYFYVEPKN